MWKSTGLCVKKLPYTVAGGALALGGVILTYGKKALDVAKKIKD